MKYRVVKLLGNDLISVIIDNVDFVDADLELFNQHLIESYRMFQDIDDIIQIKEGIYRFNCYRNGAIITYQVEPDPFCKHKKIKFPQISLN